MRKRLECEKCGKTFWKRRALAGHMRMAHNVLMGEKQEIKDHLKRLEELKEQDGEQLEKVVNIVKELVAGMETLSENVENISDKVDDIETMLDGIEKDLIEEESGKELPGANPNGDSEKEIERKELKEELKAEIKKELDEEKKKKEEEDSSYLL